METLNKRLSDVLKRKRQRYRYTQADLGATIGMSGSYISSIESGQSSVRLAELETLAAHLHTTALELLSEAASLDARHSSAYDREREAVLTLYDSLEPAQQQMAREFLQFLRSRHASTPDTATTHAEATDVGNNQERNG